MARRARRAMKVQRLSLGDCLNSYRSALASVTNQAEATRLLKEAVAALGFTDFNYGCLNYYQSMASTMPPIASMRPMMSRACSSSAFVRLST